MVVKKEIKYTNTTLKNPNKKNWQNRILIFTPTTGLVRMEWTQARYGQIIPTNWSNVEMKQWLSSYVPIEHQLADAENLMAREVVNKDFEWVLQVEHDNILPPDAFVRINEYMLENKVPIVGGLYFTKSNPPEPILYRGRGNSYFDKWKMKDKVWVDGLPFGCTLIHSSIIKALWEESPEYKVGDQVTRRVFERAKTYWFDPEKGLILSKQGTTDLNFCTRIMENNIFNKAGWPEYQKKEYPFLVDTNLMIGHIDNNGLIYPNYIGGIPKKFISDNKNYQGVEIK